MVERTTKQSSSVVLGARERWEERNVVTISNRPSNCSSPHDSCIRLAALFCAARYATYELNMRPAGPSTNIRLSTCILLTNVKIGG